MIKRLNKKQADGVVMHKIDRSARNLRDWATVGDLQDAGIDVHFAAESVDFASRGGRLTADIQAVIAADYIRNLKEEVRKGQLGRLKQGLYPFYAPLGYENTGQGQPKTVDPVLGPQVRTLFELYSTGQYSLGSLEQEMWDRGMRTRAGKKVYKSKIELLLKNPFYMGIIKLKKYPKPFDGVHEPLISPDLFNRVQQVMCQKFRCKKTKHNFLFRGLLKCQECTNSMVAERQRGHIYYRCHAKQCPAKTMREQQIEWHVLKHLTYLAISPIWQSEFVTALGKRLDELPKGVNQTNVNLEQAKVDGQLERLTQGYIDGIIDEETYRVKKQDCDFRKLELSKTAQIQVTREQNGAQVRKFLEHAKTLTRTYFYADDGEKRQMLEILFSNMTVKAKNLDVTTNNWVLGVPDFGLVPLCGAYKVSNRRRQQLCNAEIDQAIEAFTCPEAQRFCAICDEIKKRYTDGELPEIPSETAFREAV